MFLFGGCGQRLPRSRIGKPLVYGRTIPRPSDSDPSQNGAEKRDRESSSLPTLLSVVVAVCLSGCATTIDQMGNRHKVVGITDPTQSNADLINPSTSAVQVQYQRPADEQPGNPSSFRQVVDVPPAPDSDPVSSDHENVPSPEDFPFNVPLTSLAESGAPGVPGPNTTSAVPQQSSSVSTNQSPNRVSADPAPNRRAAASGGSPRSVDSVFGNASPNLRNRLQSSTGSEQEPQFHYPDIHDDPAKRYHEMFGVEEEHDPFLLPWIMNLIFEDRWLLAERDPRQALKNQFQRRMKIDIRDPDPDTANFPNGAYTLPKGRLYIENSPLGLYRGSSSGNQPAIYQWEYLIRYGLTDNLEFRVFSNGLSSEASQGHTPGFVGYQPLAFDFKANFWEENTKYHIPAMGVEIYLQTKFLGSAAFNSGTQPSINLLFDQSLPFDIGFEYNVGYTGVQNSSGQIAYQFSYQWSLQREVVKDFDVFFHGFYNAAALPRLSQFQTASTAAIPNVTVVGFGGIWTVNNRLAVFGSYNFGLTPDAPQAFALLGFALAL
jgi:hypothetical protein